jgi:Dyp-type peroxidase family
MSAVDFADMQGLLYTGYGSLPEACFLVLTIADSDAARAWLATVPVTTADQRDVAGAVQVALTAAGLQALGTTIGGFSPEFLSGIAGQESRSRRLGDVGINAPSRWEWGTVPPHALLLLYAKPGTLASLRQSIETAAFAKAFATVRVLATTDMGGYEPFGFKDGVSQPQIDWHGTRTPSEEAILPYGNLISAGEFVLGYSNEYGQYTDRPFADTFDLGRNGTYLVLRELRQDVRAFWRFAASHAADATTFAESMVGRRRDGAPLEASGAAANDFSYAADPAGLRCPLGAHVRRANPRTADISGAPLGTLATLVKMLGIFQPDLRDDLIAASRFHRLLRRGREFGVQLSPEAAMQPDAPDPHAGLHFICLTANIARQFEFIQNAWLSSNKFAGLGDEADPLTGNRETADSFSMPRPNGVRRRIGAMPPFVTVAGGGYFFLPGVRALRYVAGAASP